MTTKPRTATFIRHYVEMVVVMFAGMLVLGRNVLTLTDDGQLVLFAADPKAYEELGRARVCGKNWCIPAYADGKLYLRDDKELICLQLLP